MEALGRRRLDGARAADFADAEKRRGVVEANQLGVFRADDGFQALGGLGHVAEAAIDGVGVGAHEVHEALAQIVFEHADGALAGRAGEHAHRAWVKTPRSTHFSSSVGSFCKNTMRSGWAMMGVMPWACSPKSWASMLEMSGITVGNSTSMYLPASPIVTHVSGRHQLSTSRRTSAPATSVSGMPRPSRCACVVAL